MLRNKLVRSDGSVIDSSVIISCDYTEEVNSSENLTVGNATAAELTVEVRSTTTVQQGEVLTYYIVEDGADIKIGVFNAEKPTKVSKSSMRFSAYDNTVKTEKNFSDWLRDNQSKFPMTLLKLVQNACTHCGVTFATTSFPNSALSVPAFYADNITCRQVLMWASAIAGRFVRANKDGGLEFGWYNTKEILIQPNKPGPNDSNNGIPYFGDSLSYENYSTDKIARVQINNGENDVGVIYPANADGNCFTVSGNLILSMLQSNKLTQIATALYTQLKDISYVPSSVTVPKTIRVRAGDIINVSAANGDTFSTYIMKVAVSSSGTKLESTGDKSHNSNVAVASEKYTNLMGKMLLVEKSVDGLSVVAKDLEGNFSELKQDVNGFETRVENAEGSISSLKQTAASLTTQIKNAEGDISTLEQTATGLSSRIETAEGNISTLEQTAAGLSSRVKTAEGDISTLEQTATGLSSRIENVAGDVSALEQTATGISSRVEDVAGDVSALEQTASGLTTRVENAEGNISTVQQTADSLNTRIGDAEGNISAVQQTATNLISRVENTEGNLSLVQQTATGLSTRIEDAEGNINTLQSDANGLRSTIEDMEGRTSILEQTSEGFIQRFGVVEEDVLHTKAHIKTGLLGTNSDGTEIYGMEVGQQTEDGEFDKYARFTAEKLSFYDGNANEVAQIGDKKMAVTNVEVIASPEPDKNGYGTFKQGGFVDITLADGSIVTKWVGGA